MTDGAIEGAFYRELGRKLKLRRKAERMSQIALAAEMGCHRNTLERWESGESAIGLWELIRVSDILNCSILFLMPSREYTWGREFSAMKGERDVRRAIQRERDPMPNDDEIEALQKQVV